MRRLSIAVLLALVASTAGVLGSAAPAWASRGASRTDVTVTPDPTGYGTALDLDATVWDVSASCDFDDCNFPKGRVDFWYALPTGDFDASKHFMVSAQLGASGLAIPGMSEAEASYCCLPIGTWLIRGFYVGDIALQSGYFDPSSGDDTVTVNQRSTTTAVSQSSTSTVLGQSVSFPVQVSPAPGLDGNAARPTGFVSVGETIAGGFVSYGTAAVNQATGQATVTTSGLSAGSHTLHSSYAGDSSYGSSVSPTITHTVSRATSSGALSASTTSPSYGDSVTFTDTVSPAAAAGTVTFSDSVGGTIGTSSVTGGSPNRASASTSALAGGFHSVTATYAGNNDYQGNTSNAVYVTVARADTTTSVSSSLATTTYGQEVTFTATVGGPGSATPSGTVQFKDGGADLGAPQSLAAGVATLVTSTVPAGPHTITATYSGDGNYNGSSSDSASLVVAKAKTTTSLASSLNSSGLGDAVTFTATVGPVAAGGGTPGGTVQFKDGLRNLGPPVALTNGVGSFSTKYLRQGTHAITASFAENSNYEPSSATLPQTVECTFTLSGYYSKLTVPATGSTCLDHANVGPGGVVIPSGARVSIMDSTIKGGLLADGGAAGLTICGSTVSGKLTVKGATDYLLLGDTVEEVCFGNRFNTGVALTGNTGGLTLGDNTISGGVVVMNNVGSGPAPNHLSPEIEANSIKGKLECSGNSPVATNDGRPNSAASRTGECGAKTF
jgi:hypothetical protein